ncbi:hypothetical protein [Paenibacillus riograndensis]|uniref:Putative secreted protein n=1 Tax=Paenibacillus riograndensis SBR5 TaxID=1073571 RepID=A0A0E4HBA8_9BACL|nr:hypothetical protein [Paenibacillus riograndensis]CQR56516.1 putative secreted protein [Paenibacillus riograndensis SBR5]
MKKFVIGFVSGAVLFGGISAFAASGLVGQKVQSVVMIEKSGVKIADGAVINGAIYAPIQALAKATGTTVTIKDKKVTIGSPSASTANSTSSSSRSNPTDIGKTVNFNYKNGGYSGTVAVTQVLRGAEAWEAAKEQYNDFASEPDAGYEYLFAKIKVSILKVDKAGATADLNQFDYKLISTSGTEYGADIVLSPEPSISTKVYAGSSHEGWVGYKVKTDDASPLIAFSRNYDGTGGVWFKTK